MSYQSYEPCVACNLYGEGQTCLHHLLTRKSYPEHSEKKWNTISTCLRCHLNYHQKGLCYMANKYPRVKEWLIDNGWEFNEMFQKWIHEKDVDVSSSHV